MHACNSCGCKLAVLTKICHFLFCKMAGYFIHRFKIYAALLVLLRVPASSCQSPVPRENIGDCNLLSITDFGTVNFSSPLGLVSSLNSGISVRILDYQVVCEAAGVSRGKFSSFSAIVTYECIGDFCGDQDVAIYIMQYNFDCNNHADGASFLPPAVTYGRVQTSPVSMMVPTLRTGCGLCVDPLVSELNVLIDPNTHCAGTY